MKSRGFKVQISRIPAACQVAAIRVSSRRFLPSWKSANHFNQSAFTASSGASIVTSRASLQNAARDNASDISSGVSKRRPSVTMWTNSARIPEVMPKL